MIEPSVLWRLVRVRAVIESYLVYRFFDRRLLVDSVEKAPLIFLPTKVRYLRRNQINFRVRTALDFTWQRANKPLLDVWIGDSGQHRLFNRIGRKLLLDSERFDGYVSVAIAT